MTDQITWRGGKALSQQGFEICQDRLDDVEKELRDVRSALGAAMEETAIDAFYRGLTDMCEHFEGVRSTAASVVEAIREQLPDGKVVTLADEDLPRVILDMLILTGADDAYGVTEEEITGWPAEDRNAVEEWAASVHLSASDHDDVEVPPVPAVIRERHAASVGRRCEGA